MTWEIHLTDYKIPLLNTLLRGHWSRRSAALDELEILLRVVSYQGQRPPHAKCRRRISIQPEWKTRNFPDPDSYWKWSSTPSSGAGGSWTTVTSGVSDWTCPR